MEDIEHVDMENWTNWKSIILILLANFRITDLKRFWHKGKKNRFFDAISLYKKKDFENDLKERIE